MALKDGNFPAVEEKSHMVLRLADGWQPPGWTGDGFGEEEDSVWDEVGDFHSFGILRFDLSV